MKLYAGLDLHKNNSYIGIVDSDNKPIYKNRLANDLSGILAALKPYESELESIAVESTFNWYWLVDGLMADKHNVRLANPCAIKQYDGMKYSDDDRDALHLANLLRLDILPEGYIYPKEERPTRDLLRKRLMLVRQRTSHILSFQNLVCRNTGQCFKSGDIKKFEIAQLEPLLHDGHLVLSGRMSIEQIKFLSQQIKLIEDEVTKVSKLRSEYANLLSVPGIGKILALTIMLETGDISRFKSVGSYASYCRLVQSVRISNGKHKGSGNRKCGNKYLSWAYVEAANFAVRYSPEIHKYHQRKTAKTNAIVARKTIAHKLARACYWIMKNGEVFDISRAFS